MIRRLFSRAQTAPAGNDISYFGASRQAPVHFLVSSAVSKCILNVQTPLCPGQSSIILIAVYVVEFCSFGYPTSLQ